MPESRNREAANQPVAAPVQRVPPRFTLILMLLLAAQSVATDLYLPALPAIGRALGPAGSSLTLFVLAFGVGQLLTGTLADRAGRRPVLLGGLALYALASVAAACAGSVAWLAGCRALQGLAMAAVLVCARASVRDLYAFADGPRVMARGLSGLGAVAMVAPVVGALVVQWWSWRWALGCMALYALAVLGLCWRSFGETLQSGQSGQSGRAEGLSAVFASPGFWAWTAVSCTAYGGIFCFLLLSSAVYVDYLGLSTLAYGWIPASGSLVYIVSTTACRHLLRRYTPVQAVQWGSWCSLAGAATLVAGCLWLPHALWPLLVGHWVYTLGHGIHQPCSQAGAMGQRAWLAGRSVAWSGFFTMAVAFGVGHTAAHFVEPAHHLGAWPMVLPMAVSAVLLWLLGRLVLPRLQVP